MQRTCGWGPSKTFRPTAASPWKQTVLYRIWKKRRSTQVISRALWTAGGDDVNRIKTVWKRDAGPAWLALASKRGLIVNDTTDVCGQCNEIFAMGRRIYKTDLDDSNPWSEPQRQEVPLQRPPPHSQTDLAAMATDGQAFFCRRSSSMTWKGGI